MELSWISVIPPLLAVVLAFITRDAVISLLIACLAGVLLMGEGIAGFPSFLVRALGNEDFMWICAVELCIGVLVAFLQRSGAVKMFTQQAGSWVKNRRQVNMLGWGLGLTIFFSDYFTPLFVGPVMRNITDKYRISREKLAYICDSTAAPLLSLIPITSWAVYVGGLTIGHAGIEDKDAAIKLFIESIPYNFYGFLAVVLVALLGMGIIPEFGPMKKAERRAEETGKVLRDGAVPMMGKELTTLEPSDSHRTSIILNFILPIGIVIGTNVITFTVKGSADVLESYMLAVTVLGITLWLQRVDRLRGIMEAVLAGVKGVMPAVLILALAYGINALSREMGTAQYVVSVTEAWLSPALLPVMTFFISGFISFATGTSWGTYAIMVPISVPLAYQFNGEAWGPLVFSTFAAVSGGGVFGDHCSPLSDTTVLSSLGCACDHIDHVKTQLPYTLLAAGIAAILYLIIGFGL
ncbi:MAG: Na+/H+ antiporter NhaC family protein [Candidatus Marinimicrobia bacterium]|jgi:Na+/H+ antiporter NhaC|nr:Na+/H+ antiporter NhaC family protein [Candidatus Neomarinimicrobiota bacterium]|tara:strand:- start:3907 stop:5304 length:1398 start_codon:yes stop_codon:yes gene_type:complete